MSVQISQLPINEVKIASNTNNKSPEHSWEVRARRLDRLQQRLRHRAKRQIDQSTRGTETTEAVDRSSASDEKTLPSRISAGESGKEWTGATGGPPAEVVVRLHPEPTTVKTNFSLVDHVGPSGIVVRAEEALIVTFVLLLWVAAIALFFNRWGKIRMLEPYQPKFQQQHRQSCALAETSVSVPPHHRASLSRGCVSYDCGAGYPAYQPCGYQAHRARNNSVFVGSMALIPESPPRRSRSAADLPALPADLRLPPRPSPRASRAASLHSSVDLRLCVPAEMPVQVHVRGSGTSLNRPRSPRRLTITNV